MKNKSIILTIILVMFLSITGYGANKKQKKPVSKQKEHIKYYPEPWKKNGSCYWRWNWFWEDKYHYNINSVDSTFYGHCYIDVAIDPEFYKIGFNEQMINKWADVLHSQMNDSLITWKRKADSIEYERLKKIFKPVEE